MKRKRLTEEEEVNPLIERLADWQTTPDEERQVHTIDAWAKKNKVTPMQAREWKKMLESLEKSAESEVEAFMKHLYATAMKPGATAKHMELYAKLTGLLAEKAQLEVNIYELTPDQHIAQFHEAQRYLREHGFMAINGTSQVLTESEILSN